MYYSTNPKAHLLAKRIFHVVFFSFSDKESTADCWFACFQENMSMLVQMLQRFEARQVQVLLQIKVSSTFQSR